MKAYKNRGKGGTIGARASFVCFVITLLITVGAAKADTITVGPGPGYDFNNIQAAIDDANDGDEVVVADGTYTGPGNRNIDFLGKDIIVRSENGAVNCIIDVEASQRGKYLGFLLRKGEKKTSVIQGFTITGGFMPNGGGISCRGSSPTIKNCIITKNISGHGGGIALEESEALVIDCLITGNEGWDVGGGIYCGRDSSPVITNCNITANKSYGGGGIYCYSSSPKLINCTIGDNTAYLGGGICCEHSNLTINNCTITNNSAYYGGGTYYRGSGEHTLSNCILYYNKSPEEPQIYLWEGSLVSIEYSNIQGGYQGLGNIDKDPCFIEPGYWADANDPNIIVEPNDPNAVWLEGDYHLLPASPCIDTGDPNYISEPNETDLDGNPRISGPRIDMGAYESNYIEAEINFTPKTINCNSRGNWVKAHITLPDGFLPEDVDVNTPAWAEPLGVQSEYIKLLGSNPVKLEIAFDRRAFCDAITEPGELEMTILGSLTTGQTFYATDTIRVINKSDKRN